MLIRSENHYKNCQKTSTTFRLKFFLLKEVVLTKIASNSSSEDCNDDIPSVLLATLKGLSVSILMAWLNKFERRKYVLIFCAHFNKKHYRDYIIYQALLNPYSILKINKINDIIIKCVEFCSLCWFLTELSPIPRPLNSRRKEVSNKLGINWLRALCLAPQSLRSDWWRRPGKA